ncbi:sigma factor-like helix-turn-helix DNA-binding protein [Antribacter gilvus]|uniref:sigma factor-like helix-turn-helix DNA-binding protein n=1 Tax=Antribacter gilvus TaxID=2304675 RepID=UPI00197DBD0E|nr:sigma factor-like helix-turn-helix DNA-binding protein [Antribacter gilvus]
MPDALAPDEPPRWVDAFPWLQGTADPGWTAPGDPSDDARLAAVARLAVETQHAEPISRLFPRLAPDLALQELPLPPRLTNVLRRHALRTGSDLERMCVDDLLGSMQVGPWTVHSIFQAFAALSVSPPPVLDPDDAGDQEAAPVADPTALLTGALGSVDERMRVILRRRLLTTDVPATLQDLGAEFGVTRERVRQLEKKTLVVLAAPLGLPPGPVREILEAYRGRGADVDAVLDAALGEPGDRVTETTH